MFRLFQGDLDEVANIAQVNFRFDASGFEAGYFEHVANDAVQPFGRFLIATIECAAALLLLTSMFSAIGAIVAVSTMTGAAIAHLTHLGFAPGGDGGRMVLFLALELVSAGIVLYVRRKNIPFLGETL